MAAAVPRLRSERQPAVRLDTDRAVVLRPPRDPSEVISTVITMSTAPFKRVVVVGLSLHTPPLLPPAPAPAAPARLRRERPLAPRAHPGAAEDLLAAAQLRRADMGDDGTGYDDAARDAGTGLAARAYGGSSCVAPETGIGHGIDGGSNEAIGGGRPKRRRLRGKQPAGCSAERGECTSNAGRGGLPGRVDHAHPREADHGGGDQRHVHGGVETSCTEGQPFASGLEARNWQQPTSGPENVRSAAATSPLAVTSLGCSGPHRARTVSGRGTYGSEPNSSGNSASGGPSRFSDTFTRECFRVLPNRDGHELHARRGGDDACGPCWSGRPPDLGGGAA